MKKIIVNGSDLEETLKQIYHAFFNKNSELSFEKFNLPSIVKTEFEKAFRLLKKGSEFGSRKGRFIVVTGVDKSGKETHTFNPHNLEGIISVKDFLSSKNFNVLNIRQPSYETIIGELVGAYLGRTKTRFYIKGKVSSKYAWILWSLDRAQHIDNVEKWLSADKKHIVLSKRWTESNVIYQYFNGISKDVILNFEKRIPKPDFIIIIDIPIEELIHRLDRTRRDNYEKIEYLRKIRDAFIELPKFYPYGEVFLINGKGDMKETNERIISCLSKIINKF